jgi:hypothetical protein
MHAGQGTGEVQVQHWGSERTGGHLAPAFQTLMVSLPPRSSCGNRGQSDRDGIIMPRPGHNVLDEVR